MSFFYLLASLMNPGMGIDQYPGYFPNFSNFGGQNEEYYNSSFFSMPWQQHEVICYNDGLGNAPTTVPAEDVPSQVPSSSPQQPIKRRI